MRVLPLEAAAGAFAAPGKLGAAGAAGAEGGTVGVAALEPTLLLNGSCAAFAGGLCWLWPLFGGGSAAAGKAD